MARIRRPSRGKQSPDPQTQADDAPAKPSGATGLPLPSPVAGTNLIIADIVLRAAGGLLKDRMEKGLLINSYGSTDKGKAKGRAKAEQLVAGRGIATSMALWGASRLARRSPLGLAVVAGSLAAKVFYDRGKRLEKKRRAKAAPSTPGSNSES